MPSPDRATPVVQLACASLTRHVRWVRALGWLNLAGAAFLALTIVGLLLAWALAWVGVVLLKAATALDRANQDPANFDAHMQEAMRQLALHVFIQAVVCVLMLVLLLLG
jgi:hypothetical protein